ncbi:MAG: ArsB/NhaD family transporter [Anaerolineaceae bacterium]
MKAIKPKGKTMWVAILIFVIVYAAIASEKFPRHWVTMLGGCLLVVFGIMSPKDVVDSINWETLGLLAGMFVLVSILTESGFFHWLAMTAMRKVKYRPAPLFVVLILMAAFLSMFMDSITVMLFLSALTVQLCHLLRLDPIPVVIAEVCAANAGGSATLVGDPPNVILGTTLGFSFADFATHTGPIAIASVLVILLFFYLVNRKQLKASKQWLTDYTIMEIEYNNRRELNPRLTKIGLIAFLIAVLLLIFHLPLSHLLGIHINAATAALIPATVAIFLLSDNHKKAVILKLDGESILFFCGLFILIGGLEKVHIFEGLAKGFAQIANADPNYLVMALHWIPGLLSGVVDNVPLALAMSYVLKDLAAIPGMPALSLMVWSLALGVDIGGSMTPIGASANVVAYSYLEHRYEPVGWKKWLKLAVPATLLAMIVASVLILAKSLIGWY